MTDLVGAPMVDSAQSRTTSVVSVDLVVGPMTDLVGAPMVDSAQSRTTSGVSVNSFAVQGVQGL